MKQTLDQSLNDRVHFGLVLATLALLGFGALMVASATATMPGHAALMQRDYFGIALGLIPLVVLWAFDYRRLKPWAGPLLVALAFLVISPRIPGLGATLNGATSWLKIGGIRLFQPSEPAKLLFIIVMAAVISEYEGHIEHVRDVLRVTGYIAVPVVLIMMQPDLGTALVFVVTAVGMLVVGGMKPRWFVVLGLAGVLFVGLVFGLSDGLDHVLLRGQYDPAYVAALQKADGNAAIASREVTDTSVLIKRYQVNRLLVFTDPSIDPQGAGYNLAQSKIAIGSGGLTGVGLDLGGTNQRASQSRLNFIPESYADFIFAVLGEQMGFLGALLLLALYLALLSSALSISTSSRDVFGALIAAGLVSMWAFQILENAGMTMGMMPITGIPLPYLSYGSSFMVTNLAGVGILLSIWSRRYGTNT
jgi:rod shape determining protein RodA